MHPYKLLVWICILDSGAMHQSINQAILCGYLCESGTLLTFLKVNTLFFNNEGLNYFLTSLTLKSDEM